jgi:hypothetical protein
VPTLGSKGAPANPEGPSIQGNSSCNSALSNRRTTEGIVTPFRACGPAGGSLAKGMK